ncbi:MAG: alpha/beta hydrolase [Firmicutes bacterium]|nr:alpha/beta hydrolase [Bacillota bacterium]
MTKKFLTGKSGYDIPCLFHINGDEKLICIVCHGFGSSKESPTAALMAEILPAHGAGVIAFDLPAHGESPVDGDFLRVENCINDLVSVEEFAHSLAPDAELVYFCSSFGAYLTLLYFSSREHLGKKAFLRSAAVDMPGIFKRLSPEQLAELKEKGSFMVDMDYVRPLKITKDFLADMKKYNLFELYRPDGSLIHMIHGEADELAFPEDAGRFAGDFNIPITWVEKGDHRLSVPGAPELVAKTAMDFFGIK